MASLQVTIPDSRLTRVVNAIAATYGYNAATDGTKAAFARRHLAQHVRAIVVAYEVRIAGEQAAEAASAVAESEMDGIV